MCGLAGVFQASDNDQRCFERSEVKRMTDAIAHRGPDESGIHIEPHVALGHRRLSIIDLATGQQPLFNEDGSVCIVYNGEIYNFPALTKELQAAGHVFRTHSDTEVIVHAWEQWGEQCVERFRGMFAFALWDRNRKTLFLARDRLGVKPLYYGTLADGTFAFGSELKCLTVCPNFNRKFDDFAIEEYFAFGYIPDPRTIYVNASKLPPAHTLIFRVGDERPRLRQYWDVSFEPNSRLSLDDAAHELRDRLREAVSMRMIAEVPLGAFLSGGVDSSIVVATMASVSSEPINTCSIGFDVPDFDESRYAEMVARRYGTAHRNRVVDSEDFLLVDQIAQLYDEPFADSSAMPTYRVCQLAREQVTVALSGDGGDETFGGYRRYRLHLMEERLRNLLPLAVRRTIFAGFGAWFPKLDRLPRPLRAKTTLQALGRSSLESYFNTVSILRDEERSSLYSGQFKRQLAGYNAIEVFNRHARTAPTDQPLAFVQYLDYKTYLPGDINTKVDRASMAHSLEVREPLMDHELVEWVARMPQSLKMSDGQSKRVLKRSGESLLPHEVLYRQKMGFAVPLAKWFRGPLRAQVSSLLEQGEAARSGHLDPGQLKRIFRQHMSGERDWSAAIWSIFCFSRFISLSGGTRLTTSEKV